mmetsp:Transcript_26944/g.53813  ORF Transcript_26944/g.53813 Transcript_26944/m.53813 type:complete len:108 (-) Transcript_26944:152-475(-)
MIFLKINWFSSLLSIDAKFPPHISAQAWCWHHGMPALLYKYSYPFHDFVGGRQVGWNPAEDGQLQPRSLRVWASNISVDVSLSEENNFDPYDEPTRAESDRRTHFIL